MVLLYPLTNLVYNGSYLNISFLSPSFSFLLLPTCFIDPLLKLKHHVSVSILRFPFMWIICSYHLPIRVFVFLIQMLISCYMNYISLIFTLISYLWELQICSLRAYILVKYNAFYFTEILNFHVVKFLNISVLIWILFLTLK